MVGADEPAFADESALTERQERDGGPPPLPRASGISDDSGLYEDVVAEATDPASDLEAPWLYKRGGAVFGPVSSKTLLEKLYCGEIDAGTPISPEDGEFLFLRRYGAFAVHLTKVSEHQRQLKEVAAEEKHATHARMRKRVALIVLLSLIGTGVFVVTIAQVREHRIARVDAEKKAELAGELESLYASVTIEPPLADVETESEEPALAGRPPARRGGGSRGVAKVSRGAGTGELTSQEIMEGVASVFGGFKDCIVAQMQRDRDSVPDQIVLSFAIDNEGRIQDPTVDERSLRKSPLMDCMRGSLATVRYRSFKGEVRNVEYPITVGRR